MRRAEVSRMAGGLACPRCEETRCIRFGKANGHQRWRCRACGRTRAETLGTPLFHLHTPLPEIVRAILIVLHRGSLRAAEEQTGHNYAAIAAWIRRLGEHAEAVTETLVHDLELSEVEVDELCLV
jgi:transposase-like protein